MNTPEAHRRYITQHIATHYEHWRSNDTGLRMILTVSHTYLPHKTEHRYPYYSTRLTYSPTRPLTRPLTLTHALVATRTNHSLTQSSRDLLRSSLVGVEILLLLTLNNVSLH